jgi:H+/gluconate symporter-like permease
VNATLAAAATQRSELKLMRVAVPALAGLSVPHGLIPPHPGPLIAIAATRSLPGSEPASATGSATVATITAAGIVAPLTIGETFKSWSVMETPVSLIAFAFIMALSVLM